MNNLVLLIGLFDKGGTKMLREYCLQQVNLTTKLVLLVLNKRDCSAKEAMAKLSISENTFNKTCSLARNYLLKELEGSVSTPFDNIYIIQKLTFSGETSLAQKLIYEKEKELEKKQLWLQLETLYVEAFRISYTNGDISKAVEIEKKRNNNALRLTRYIQLYSKLGNEMIRIEGFKERNPDRAKYNGIIGLLKKEAMKLGHHVLIHNSHHLHYMFASRFLDSPEIVNEVINDMLTNTKKFESVMNPLSKAITLNTRLNFLTIYKGFGNPEAYVSRVKKVIHHTGMMGQANMCYAMLEYYLYLCNIPKVMEWLNELKGIEDNSKFRQYKHVVLAIKAFIENENDKFKEHFSSFYRDASHLDFPDMEINLRIIELITMLRANKNDLFETRSTALQKYIRRNSSKERYREERQLLVLLNNVNEKGFSQNILNALRKLENSSYRSISFLSSFLKKENHVIRAEN